MKKQTYNFLMPFLFSVAILCLCYTVVSTSMAADKHAFASHSHSVTAGDTIKYKIMGLRKKQSAKFFSSNTNLATIKKKTGKLTSKKAGIITVSAKIYNKKGKKINTLKTKLTIIENTVLPNATFKVNGSINPWNFQIQLSCSRILLQKEVHNSNLTVTCKNNKNKKISAAFSSLSTDGKKITYMIPNDLQKILCPGDTSMNGTYEITSPILPKTLSISYQERITDDSISGFVLQNNGNPVQDAFIRINTVSGIMETTTDSTGYYQMKNVKNPSEIAVSKTGYQTQSLTSFSSLKQGALCENFILKKNSKNAALECIVTDEENIPVPDAVVTLALDEDISENEFLCQAATDANGMIIFDNYTSTDNLKNIDCSIIYPDSQNQLSYISSYSFISSNRYTISSGQFSPETPIAVYISKNYMGNNSSIHYETQKCQLSFQYLMSNHISLRICLKKSDYRPLQSLPVKWESSYSPADCCSISLSLYHQTQKKPVFQKLLSSEEFSIGTIQESQNTILTILSETAYPLLPNDTFLIFLAAFNSENTLLAESGLQTCYLQNGCLYISSGFSSLLSENEELPREKAVITLYLPHYVRMLLYTDNLTIPDKRISATFHLYQKKDNQYYFLGSFASDKFSGNTYSPKTANLIISGIFPLANYLIAPASSSPLFSNCHIISLLNSATYSNISDALTSPNPFFQIYCNSPDYISSPIYPDDFYTFAQDISFQSCSNITQSLIRSSSTYPNSVIAFYQNDGKLIASSLLPRPVHISDVTEPDSSPKSSVIDIYTNGEILVTNQPSYQ